MDFSFKDKFSKYFNALRDSLKVFVSFNIDQGLSKMIDTISISFYYDEKEKTELDQFSRKFRLSEHSWQLSSKIPRTFLILIVVVYFSIVNLLHNLL